MRRRTRRVVSLLMALGLPIAGATAAAGPEIDDLLQGPIGKDWVSNGGNLVTRR